MSGKRVLLVVPDNKKVYEDVPIKAGAFHLPSLAFAVLASIAKRDGHVVEVLDLSLSEDWQTTLSERMDEFGPEYIGLTGTTAIFFHMIEIGRFVKDSFPGVTILAGGPHVSSTYEETLEIGCFDYVFLGEGEESFSAFLRGDDPDEIQGLACIDSSGELRVNPHSGFLKNLDDYPFPAYEAYDLSDYPVSPMHARQNPVLWIETSRGCPFDCKICNKEVHGQTFRPKSPERVLAEIEHFHEMGVREFHISDDGFTSNIPRAEAICEGLIQRKLGITWSCTNGIRVDRVNLELLKKMKRAGCYRIAFGIESGNQGVLDLLGKKTTLEQVAAAVEMAGKAGIETFGYFMFGFMNDTPETMKQTIRLARKLPLDLAKASLIMPFPGSPLHKEYTRKGLVYPPGDYKNYNVYKTPRDVYRHPTLSWDEIERHQKQFTRTFYLDPKYILRKLKSDIRHGGLVDTIRAALSVKWF